MPRTSNTYSKTKQARISLNDIKAGDVTLPTGGKWSNLLDALTPVFYHGTDSQRAIGIEQLKKMAAVADQFVMSKTPSRKPGNKVVNQSLS